MKKYKFKIREILEREVEIEAKNEEEAEEKIYEKYKYGEIALDWEDHINTISKRVK